MPRNDLETRLLSLTLAVEQAVAREDWAEAEGLLAAGEQIIVEAVAAGQTISDEAAQSLEEIHGRLLFRLELDRRNLLTDMHVAQRGQDARRAYASSTELREFDDRS